MEHVPEIKLVDPVTPLIKIEQQLGGFRDKVNVDQSWTVTTVDETADDDVLIARAEELIRKARA